MLESDSCFHGLNHTESVSNRAVVAEFLMIWAVFLLHAGFLIPELNEPNYLARARHFWNPDWCANDFFLQTASAHQTFNWLFGWLTLFLPLPTVALVGRLSACALLAYGWGKLSRALVPRFGWAVVSAALLVSLQSHFHMAGEWFVGGIEAKGFAYGFVFLGLASLVSNRWNRAWILLGIAAALHALVGGWSIAVATFAWCWLRRDSERPSIGEQKMGLLFGTVISLAGFIPAIMLSLGVRPEITQQAAQIQVFHRLPHHLNPGKFLFEMEPPYGIRFLVLLIAWLVLLRFQSPAAIRPRRLTAFVLGTILVAVLGIAVGVLTIGRPILSALVLRFYWFRMADVFLPIGITLTGMAVLWQARAEHRRWVPWGLATIVVVAGWNLGQLTLDRLTNSVPRPDRKIVNSEKEYQDWYDVCAFARNKTPDDSVFFTPRNAHTFKWYADRAEVVSWKEMPQDAESVVEWWNRIEHIHGTAGARRRFAERTPQQLRELAILYHADYLIAPADPVIELTLVHKNNTFAVYSLKPD